MSEADWIEWAGGENPVPGLLIDADIGCVTMRNCLSDILRDGWLERGRYRLVPSQQNAPAATGR